MLESAAWRFLKSFVDVIDAISAIISAKMGFIGILIRMHFHWLEAAVDLNFVKGCFSDPVGASMP